MQKLKILLAKGRIYEAVYALLVDAGISLTLPDRTYFPITNQADLSFQIVKPQIVSELLAAGKADAGFSGQDWVAENGAQDNIEQVLDLGFDRVRIVAATPESVNFDKLVQGKNVTVATEYQNLAHTWLEDKGISGTVLRTWGASEGFVQDTTDSNADILIDNTSTGNSLKANRLKVVDTLMESSTRFYASSAAMADCGKRRKVDELAMLFSAVLDARDRVMLEMNVAQESFDALVATLPAMRSPTVSPLFGGQGYSVKIAVKKSEVPSLLPRLKAGGATDILEYELRKVMA